MSYMIPNVYGDVQFSRKEVKTKLTHPYSYDPIVQYRHPDTKANGTVYTDRLLQWDFAKHDRLCEKHFGDTGQYWDRRDPNLIANFLRDWYDNPEIVLCEVIEYCNVSTGYPTWRLDFWVPG